MGAMPAEGLYLLIARVATAYYFLYFSKLSFCLAAAKLGVPPSTGSVILKGKGIVFSLNPNTGKIIKK